jgi:hypothetical protein
VNDTVIIFIYTVKSAVDVVTIVIMLRDKMQCQRLDQQEKRCRRKAVYIEHYHGESELYSHMDYKKDVTLVEIFVCGVHRITPPDSENYIGKIEENRKE